MLKHGEINPLNVFGLRKVDHRPPHFDPVLFEIKTSEKKILDWIYENLEGRFWMGDVYSDPGSQKSTGEFFDKTSMCKCVAFEEHSEASYFALCLDQVNTYSNIQ